MTNWESVSAISIDDHTNVTEAIKAFFEEALLTGQNLYACSHCGKKSLEVPKSIL